MPFNIQNGVLVRYTYENITIVTIPDKIVKIGTNAFRGCIYLIKIIIPGSVKEIGEDAFASCIKISAFWIPDSVTSIGKNAFEYCTSLSSISIPEHLREIAEKRDYYGISPETEILIRKFEIPKTEPAPPPKPEKKPPTKKANPEPSKTTVPKNLPPQEVCEKTELEMIFEYFKMSEDKDARIYIQNHLAEFMQFLIDKQNVERITEITEHTDFLTADNIDEFLKYSIQNSENGGSFKIQLILTNYKAKLLNL